MGGVVDTVSSVFGGETGAEQDAKRRQQQAEDMARDAQQKQEQQDKAIQAQKKAEQEELQAKQKRMAQAGAGNSGLLNLNPSSQSSILG